MNNNEDQRKQDLVDSLLRSLYETDEERSKSLVSGGMERIEKESTVRSIDTGSRLRSSLQRWLSVAAGVAVLVLIVLSLPLLDSTRNATAAVMRSFEQAVRDIGRHYKVKLNVRFPDQSEQSYSADLYVKGGRRFAIQVFGPIQQARPFWLGTNAEKSWVVPPVGPVLEGTRRNLNQWAENREELATPYLHIATALELMRDQYELTSLPDEALEVNGRKVQCKRVNGRLKGKSSRQVPDQFELWADSETGVAMRIVASWNLEEGGFGRQSILIQFQAEENLANEFFTPQAHGGEARNKINFSKERK